MRQSSGWLRHKSEKELARLLLIIERDGDADGKELMVRMGMDGPGEARWVKYEEASRAKGTLGGYENKKSLYLPVEHEIANKRI